MTLRELFSASEIEVLSALKLVIDPETGENIVDLGLIYGMKIEQGTIEVNVTMTSPACPMIETILENVYEALTKSTPKGTDIKVEIVWEPIWNPSMMSAETKERLGWTDLST